MTSPLQSLIASGTKVWLDSVDPNLVRTNLALGATGATSNPIIIAELVQSGRFDDQLERLLSDDVLTNEDAAWQLTDGVVRAAQAVFLPVWKSTRGDDGYVSFELDPLLEDPGCPLSRAERVARYVELGRRWSANHENRMIKVPATPAGLDSLEELSASGVTLNVTLIFTTRQYEAARNAIWRGAQRRKSLDRFKSVYSIFISRVDMYTKNTYRIFRPRRRGRSALSAQNESGSRINSSRPNGPPRYDKKSSSPARARKSRMIPRGNTSSHWPAAISRPIHQRRMTPSRKAVLPFGALWINCQRPKCSPKSTTR